MQNDNLIGRMVRSKAGRDKDKHFIIIGVLNSEYVLLADGKLRFESKPKKKKLRHLQFTDIISEEIKNDVIIGNELMNSKIKKFLQLNDMNKEV